MVDAYYSKTTRVADSRGELSVSHPLHASLHNGYYLLLATIRQGRSRR